MGDRLFYVAFSRGSGGQGLWTSDGTDEGTHLVTDIRPGRGSPWPEWLTAVGGHLYFTADGRPGGIELWTSDGTPVGTRRVADLEPGRTGSAPRELVDVGGILYFSAETSATGRELWRSDGTAAGTILVRDIRPAPDVDADATPGVGPTGGAR